MEKSSISSWSLSARSVSQVSTVLRLELTLPQVCVMLATIAQEVQECPDLTKTTLTRLQLLL